MNNKKKAAVLQRKVVNFLLSSATLMAVITFIVVPTFKVVATVVSTEFQLLGISNGISYYEEQRSQALQTGRGDYATECDKHIVQLYAERAKLVSSENNIVAFTATHKYSAAGLVLVYLILVVITIMLVTKNSKQVSRAYRKLIRMEELILRFLISGIAYILFFVFAVLAKSFNIVWSQTKIQKKARNNDANNGKIIPLKRRA